MGFCRYALLALATLNIAAIAAKDKAETSSEEIIEHSDLKVKVQTSFPQSEIFGVKLVNGQVTEALISIENEESSAINIAFVGGTLWAPDPKTNGETSLVVRNLTSTRYNIQIPAGEKESVSYSFSTIMHPQQLRLQLIAIATSDAGSFSTLNAFNETVSIVEPDASIFDPQMIFLYLLLLGMFVGSSYWIYTTWIATLFPQKTYKAGDRTKKPAGKKVDPSGQISVVDADGTAVTTGAKAYDESWIPAHHFSRPEAKRVKSGGGRSKKGGKVE